MGVCVSVFLGVCVRESDREDVCVCVRVCLRESVQIIEKQRFSCKELFCIIQNSSEHLQRHQKKCK